MVNDRKESGLNGIGGKNISNTKKNTEAQTSGIFQIKLEKNIFYLEKSNAAASSVLDVDNKSLLGKPLTDIIVSKNSEILLQKLKDTAVKGVSIKNGSVEISISGKHFNLSFEAHQIEKNQLIFLFENDSPKIIPRQNRATDELIESIYKGVENIIFIVDVAKEGGFILSDANPAYERLTKMKLSDIKGKSPIDTIGQFSQKTAENIIKNYTECVRKKKIIKYEEIVDFKGEERWWLTTLNPLLNNANQVYQIIGTTFEITEQKKSDAQIRKHKNNLEKIVNERTSDLKESEVRFRRLADNIRDGIRIIEDGKLVYVNNGFCKITGYSKNELFDINGLELVHEKDFDWIKKTIKKKNQSLTMPKEIKFWINKKGGTPRLIHNNYSIWKKNGGTRTLYIFTVDITEEERSKEQLLLQSSALNAAANGISITDKQGSIIWVNDALCQLTNYTRDEIIGKNHRLFKSGLQSPEFYKKMWKTISSGKVWRGEVQNRRKGGELYHEELIITPVKVRNSIKHFIAIKQDITRRKEHEIEIAKRERKYRSLFENSHNPIMSALVSGRLLEMNQAAKRMLGIKAEKIDELSTTEFINDKTMLQDFIILLKEKGFVKNFATDITTKDNSTISCLINATLHKSENGGEEFFQAIIFDVTEQLKAKHLLEDALDEAEKANNVKSEFLAQMSHEIRTPLTVILSYINLIKTEVTESLPKDLQELFPAMERAGKRIIRTIELLLNVAELNAGTYKCNFKEMDLYERVLENIYLEYKKEALTKNIKFNIIKTADDCGVVADEHTLSEIFKNLIDNAVKYTSSGSVDIMLKRNKDKKLEVEIIDTGIGIEESYLPDLFEPFTQEEMGYTRRFEGNGLGLALAQKYAKLNKAKIYVESKKDYGSKFIVKF